VDFPGQPLARVAGEALEIDTWLMSCRVLKRGVEQFLLNHLVGVARSRGLRKLCGEYIPTSKNALVRDHFADLGFTRVKDDRDGRTLWVLNLLDDRPALTTFITEMPADAIVKG
jgi:predicted enzyme involved in methoxymalonyl-ACP biosynthesis